MLARPQSRTPTPIFPPKDSTILLVRKKVKPTRSTLALVHNREKRSRSTFSNTPTLIKDTYLVYHRNEERALRVL
jgi:hypothetical protein